MQTNKHTHNFETNGAVVFFRGEHEPPAKERLGILEDKGASGLFIATRDFLPAGSMLQMRIYNQKAPPGQAELSVRGVVKWLSQEPKGVGVQFVDTRELKDARLTATPPTNPELRM